MYFFFVCEKKMKTIFNSAVLFISILLTGCSFPEDKKDNPNNETVVHTGNATDTFPVDSTGSTAMSKVDSARMVYNDDSSVNGTPSGRGTTKTGEAVGTGTSRPGENYPNPNHRSDSAYRK